jgi:UDP:flavonoid glycosyltransferase YjiC (YdhE family)
MAYDQYDNAARTAQLGVAETLQVRDFTPNAVRRKLDRLINRPEVQARCEQVAANFQDIDPAGRAADVIESVEV